MEAEHPEVPVVLVTAHAEHAVAAFDADVRDYVLKPVRRERLERALGRLHPPLAEPTPQIHITIGRREYTIPLDELDCFMAEGGHVLARSAKVEGFVSESLHELEEQLGGKILRLHRACLAVRSSIAGMSNHSTCHSVIFRDGLDGVTVSRRKVGELRTLLRQRGRIG
jgi:two-component system, LytTR family, response regulator AlgR